MKKISRLILVLALLLVVNMPAVLAIEVESNNSMTTTSNTDKTPAESDTVFIKRQEERKKQQKVALSTAEKTKIKARCQAAQTKLNPDQGRVKGVMSNREENYGKLVNKLNELNTKLKAANVNTTQLEANIATLQTKIMTFKNDMAVYHLALQDLVKLQCQQDPDAFKAALLVVRTNVEKVKTDTHDIKEYVNGTIKPQLKELRLNVENTKDN